jgi:hypothetical protein
MDGVNAQSYKQSNSAVRALLQANQWNQHASIGIL